MSSGDTDMAMRREHGGIGRAHRLCVAAGLGMAAATAVGQPVLVVNGLADDLSSDGARSTGLFFDADLSEYVAFVWERGVGYTRVVGGGLSAEPVRGSGDLTVLATGKINSADWGGLNCFAGYCTYGDCEPGTPLAPPNPCQVPTIAHSWSAGTGWVNAGSVERVRDEATGRYYGGTRCDSTINSVNDVSGDGRWLVGGAWTAGLVRGDGSPASGQCGGFAAFAADRLTGEVTALAAQPGTTSARADSVSDDGSVITGYDLGEIVDPNWGTYEGRRICVWVDGVSTLIDALSGTGATYPVNGAGTVVAGATAPAFNLATFGVDDTQLVKWTRQGDGSWSPQALGRLTDYFDGNEVKPLLGFQPAAVSDDGNLIVGTASYGSGFFDRINRAFIWSPDINEGSPMDLGAYLEGVAPGSPIVEPGLTLTAARGVSADGNAISVSMTDARTTCTPQDLGLQAGTHGVLYLNGAGIGCDAPRVAVQPKDWVSTQYTPFGVALNVFASGSWPMAYAWQREDPQNPGQWLDLSEACSGFPYGGEWDYEGVSKSQLRIGQATCGNHRDGRYRVVITNGCGTVVSDAATVTFEQGTRILEQPSNVVACAGSFASAFAVAVSNSADLASQWEIAPASDPEAFTPLADGLNTLSDGRVLDVFGAQGQFLGMTPGRMALPSAYLLRCRFTSPCGDAMSRVVTFNLCPADFNCDGFVDFFDYDDFVAGFESGVDGADVNGDGFIDFFDYDDFVSVFESGC